MNQAKYPQADGMHPTLISGHAGREFSVAGHRAFVIFPSWVETDGPQGWVWYAPTLPGLPAAEEQWMLQQFLDAGLAIVGIDVGESYGSPSGRALFGKLYTALVQERGFARRAALLARSRGGLMLYNWAVEHPQRVACVAGIYPVCNLSSYPGLAKACGAYGLSEAELSANLAMHNPVERLAPLAQVGVPLLHLHGDVDEVVPLAQNSGLLAERYRHLGGEIELIVFPGQWHNYWPGWFHSQALVDFVIAHAKAGTDKLRL